MKPHRIVNVVGCRPNFVKLAPLVAEMRRHSDLCPIVLHTGQHYDREMSDAFFHDLDIPVPDLFLNVGPGSETTQIALIMQKLEEAFSADRPDLVLVVGDVSSTVAAALTAVKLGIPVAHVEAGLRSFDRTMPEEVNRVVTDAVSDLLFATEKSAVRNLLREGKSKKQIFLAGNVMIDTLFMHIGKVLRSGVLERLGLEPRSYALVTLHRPSNVDSREQLTEVVGALADLQKHTLVVFPVHPRTRARLESFGMWERVASLPGLRLIAPLGYIDFVRLLKESLLVLTDSGGIQEESTVLGVPCLTTRLNTERPVTVTEGTNRLVGNSRSRIVAEAVEILRGRPVTGQAPEKWDGHASERIVEVLRSRLGRKARRSKPKGTRPVCITIPDQAA